MIDPYQPNLDKKTTPGLPPKKSNQWIVLCVVIALVSILYRLLALNAYNQSSLLFIGIPLFLSIALSLTPRPKSATGIIMKGITLSMLLFGILLIEGFICILIVSPLFYLIGGIVGFIMDRNAGKNIVNCSIIGVLLLMSAEGVTEWLSFSRDETVTITKPIDFSKKEARKLLASGPRFDMSELPLFLQLGFPHPESI